MANQDQFGGVAKFERAVGNGFKVPRKHREAVENTLARLCARTADDAMMDGINAGHVQGLRDALRMTLEVNRNG